MAAISAAAAAAAAVCGMNDLPLTFHAKLGAFPTPHPPRVAYAVICRFGFLVPGRTAGCMTQSNRGVWAAGVGYLLVLFRSQEGGLHAWRLGEALEGGFGGGACVCMCSQLAVGWCVVGFGWEELGCSGDGLCIMLTPIVHSFAGLRKPCWYDIQSACVFRRVITFWRAGIGAQDSTSANTSMVTRHGTGKRHRAARHWLFIISVAKPAHGDKWPTRSLALDSAVAKPTRRSPFGEISCRKTAVWAIDRLVLRHDGAEARRRERER